MSTAPEPGMGLAELSERSRVPISSIKFYLRVGLLHPGERPAGRRARYDAAHLDRLRSIRTLSGEAGLSLDRVRETLDDGPRPDAAEFARAAELVGRAWTLAIVRSLGRGPHRVVDLLGTLGAVPPTVLSRRLRELREAGLVERERLVPSTAVDVYRLTERGLGLTAVAAALEHWCRGGGASPEERRSA